MLAADLVAQARLNGGVLEVDVVELDLNTSISGYSLSISSSTSAVSWNEKPTCFTLALFFQLERMLIGVQLLVFFKYRLRLRVQEVEVKVVHSAALEPAFQTAGVSRPRC